MRLIRPQIQPIGLNIGIDSVKLLQLEVAENRPSPGQHVERTLSVVAAAKAALPEEARKSPEQRAALAAQLIRRMLDEQPFVGKKVVASLPRAMLHVKHLRLSPGYTGGLTASVRQEAAALFPFEPELSHLQYISAGEVRQGSESRQEIIVLAAQNAEVDDYVEQLHLSGVQIVSLDSEITATFRAFERFVRRSDDLQRVEVLVDIGALQTQVIIGKGRDITFYKRIELGGMHLLDAVSRKLSVTLDEAKALRQRLLDAGEGTPRDPVRQAVSDATRSAAEELGRELAMCLRYYSVTFRGQRPSRMRIVGGESADPQLHSIFRSILSIPVEPARPLFSVDVSRMRAIDRHGPMSQWALAMGLSLRFVPGPFAPKDGRPREDKQEKAGTAGSAEEHVASERVAVKARVDTLFPLIDAPKPSAETAVAHV